MNKFISFCNKCSLMLFNEKDYKQHINMKHDVEKIVTLDKVSKKGYNKSMKKITINIEKTKDGYVLSSEELGKIAYFDDTDESRKQFITATGNLVMDVLNTEIDGGKKYL